MPRARGRALVGLCAALADGRGAAGPQRRPRPRSGPRLLALPGIGPWTADYVAMRALGDPDVFLPTDIGVRRALRACGDDAAARIGERAERWRPWRSYALMHLWSTLTCSAPTTSCTTARPTKEN